MKRRGITLLELMVSVVITAIIVAAAAQATAVALRHNAGVQASRVVSDRNEDFEARLRRLIELSYLSTVTTEASSFFIGGDNTGDTDSSMATAGGGLIFTILGEKLPADYLESTDDFETLNQTYGPRGGMTEVSLSLTPIGNDSGSQTGLFIRRQTPADGDPSQGGFESVFDSGVEQISFEFYDGTDWATSWDTQAMETPRLPAAVRVTYRRTNDAADRIFVVRLPLSDVTPDNPLTQTGGSA